MGIRVVCNKFTKNNVLEDLLIKVSVVWNKITQKYCNTAAHTHGHTHANTYDDANEVWEYVEDNAFPIPPNIRFIL